MEGTRARRRTRMMGLVAALALAAAAPQQASAQPRPHPLVGIGDETPVMFSKPLYRGLGLPIARIVVPLNTAFDPAWRARAAQWLSEAEADGVEPLVAFGRFPHTSIALPSVAAYRRAFLAFRRMFPEIRDYTPWNEANHQAQPTYRHPARAAAYYEVMRNRCPACRIAAADVLDNHSVATWLHAFLKAVQGPKPTLWGVHNYIDVNDHHPIAGSGTARILGIVRGAVWLTETGGIVHSARRPYNEQHAAAAIRYLFAYVSRWPGRISRVYIWDWHGVVNSHTVRRQRDAWDSGITEPNGRPRPSFFALKSALQRLRLGCFGPRPAGRPSPWLAGCGA